MSVQLTYTGENIHDLVEARRAHPRMSQRFLAAFIYEHTNLIFPSLVGRTRQSIYGALRRLESRMNRAITTAEEHLHLEEIEQ